MKRTLLLSLIILLPIIGFCQIIPDVLFHVEGIGSKRSSPNSNHSEVVALFENTKQTSHTAININSDLIRDPIIYFSGDELPVWDIRNDYSDGNAFNLRYQGYFGVNKTIVKFRGGGDVIIPQLSGSDNKPVYADSNGKLSVGRENILTIGPQDFDARNDDGSSVEFTYEGVKKGHDFVSDGTLRAMIHLPHQSLVNKIKIVYLDEDSNDNFSFWFVEANDLISTGGAAGNVVTFTPSGASTTWKTEIINDINWQIDNDKFLYYVSFTDDDWSEQEIRAVKIYYTE